MIDWYVDRLSVGTPDDTLRADIRARCERAGLAPAETRRLVARAIRRHHANRRLYGRVVSGRL